MTIINNGEVQLVIQQLLAKASIENPTYLLKLTDTLGNTKELSTLDTSENTKEFSLFALELVDNIADEDLSHNKVFLQDGQWVLNIYQVGQGVVESFSGKEYIYTNTINVKTIKDTTKYNMPARTTKKYTF